MPGGAVAFSVEEAAGPRVVIVAETLARGPEAQAAIARGIREACQEAFLFGPDDVKLVAPGVIPRTTSGKPRRQACRRWYQDQAAAAAAQQRDRAEASAWIDDAVAGLRSHLQETPSMTERFVEVDGVRLYCTEGGTGPALVFVHGWGLDTRSWDAQIRFFAAAVPRDCLRLARPRPFRSDAAVPFAALARELDGS